jgi:hypothetical protein
MNEKINPKVQLVNYGTGNVINGIIYMNKNLLDKPELFNQILEHEEKHLKGEEHVDLKQRSIPGLFWFMLKHPNTWVQWLPVWIIGRRIIYDKTRVFIWSIIFLCLTSLIIGFKHPQTALILAGCLLVCTGRLAKWLL